MKGLDYMMKWFKTAHSIEEVKRIYRQLCKEYHPDIHGATTEETMKQINAEYERAFNYFKNIHESAEDSTKTYTSSKETTETAAEFMVIINKLITCEGLEIDVCGKWLWAVGNTYPYKEILKGLGFRFASKKKAWYWHKAEDASRNHKEMSLDEIRKLHGCETFTGASTPKLATV